MAALPRTVSANLRVTYEVGNENNPSNPWGRRLLEMGGEGGARLEHFGVTGDSRVWQGRVAVEVLSSLLESLSRASFPDVARKMPPPGAGMVDLRVQSESYDERAFMPCSQADELPGYRDAFRTLDSIVRQLSEGSLEATPDFVPGLVTGVTLVSGTRLKL